MALMRFRAAWTGFSGAPGVNTFHFNFDEFDPATGAQACADALGTFYGAFRQWLPSGIRISIEGQVEVIDPADGTVQELISITPPEATQAGTTTTYSGPSGAVIHWLTNDVVNGRRVRGKSFIVPISTTGYDTSGTLSPTLLTDVQNAANALRSDEALQLSIWSRPVAPDPMLGRLGSQHRVTGAVVPDKAAILRSRRD